MANNEEKVRYEYTGDTRSLKRATEEAISLLTKYEKAIQTAAKQQDFTASKTSITSFQKTVNGLITQVNGLAKAYQSAGDALERDMPTGASSVRAANKDIADSLKYIQSSSGLASEDLKLLTSVLRDSKGTMSQVTGQATALATSLRTLASTSTQSAAAEAARTRTPRRTTPASSKHQRRVVSEAAMMQSAYKLTNKSALDSAKVFVQASAASRKGVKNLSIQVKQLRAEMSIAGGQIAESMRNSFKWLDPITSKMQSFKDKAASAMARVSAMSAQVSSAFKRFASKAESAHNSIKKFFKALSPIATAFKKLGHGIGKTVTWLSKLIHKLRSTGSSMRNTSSIASLLKKSFASLAGVSLGDWLARATKESIKYIENLNLFTVAMGEAVDKGHEFVKQMQEIYGLDPSNLMRYAGNFFQLATAIDMPDEAASNLSLTLTKATADISSLFNIPIEQVFEDLSSGMMGMSRAVRKYGMDIRTTTLQHTALSLGITTLVQDMSEADRQGLRFLTMMRQASNASGDFARTIETPANQLRIFKEQITQLGRAIGNFFIGPISTAIAYVNGFVMALRTALTFIGSLLGLVKQTDAAFDGSGAKDEADALTAIGSAAGGAAEKMKDLIAPFDELNVLKENQDSGGGGGGGALDSEVLDPAIADAIASMQVKLENIRMKANEVRDAILEFFGFTVDLGEIITWDPEVFEQNFYIELPRIATEFGERLAQNLNQSVANIDWATLGSVLGNSIKVAVNAALSFVNNIDFANIGASLATALNNVVEQINWEDFGSLITIKLRAVVGTIAGFIATLDMSKAAKAFGNVFKGIFSSASEAIASVDWYGLGEQVKQFIVNIDWAGIAEAAFEALGNAFGAATSFLIGLIRDAWNKVVKWWKETAFRDGKFTAKGLLKGIDDVFRTIYDWLKKHVVDPFVNGFKKLFKIHSPSKVMEELGGYMVDGLLEALASLADTVLKPFKDMWKALTDWFDRTVKPKLTAEYWLEKLKGIPEGIKGMFNSMIGHVETAVNAIVGKLNTISFDTPDWVPWIGGKHFGVNIPSVNIPRLASGGVVSSPTYSMIGEGAYSEAVIPLDNSPQMKELIQEIVNAIDKKPPGSTPVEVKVYIGPEEFDAYTYKASERGKTKVGKQPIKVGG